MLKIFIVLVLISVAFFFLLDRFLDRYFKRKAKMDQYEQERFHIDYNISDDLN